MNFPEPTLLRRRRETLWRRIAHRGVLERHPVSLTRQRIGSVLLVAIVSGIGLYLLQTRDETIRSRAVEFLRKASSAEVEVKRARFSMFGGITLHDVQVSAPYSERFDPRAVDAKSRTIFSAKSLRLVHNPWALLAGRLRVEHIIATEPTIILAQNVETGERNWQLLSGPVTTERAATTWYRPRITLRSAKAVVVSIDRSGTRDQRTEELDADARPQPESPSRYYIDLRQYSEPPERTPMVFDPGEKLVVNTPFVDAEMIRLQLPRLARDFFEKLSLSGEVKLSRYIYASEQHEERDTEIELRHVRCAVPLSLLSSGTGGEAGTSEAASPGATRSSSSRAASEDSSSDPSSNHIDLTDVEGRLSLRDRRLSVDIRGRLDGAPCTFLGTLADVSAPLHEMGLDLMIRGERVPAPEDAIRTYVATHPSVPSEVREFFLNYDPRGAFDLNLDIRRQSGPHQPLVLLGSVDPMLASGTPRWFPYRIERLEGRLRFEPGFIRLEDIRGVHGDAVIEMNGVIDRTKTWADVDIDVVGRYVRLDSDLYSALSPEYQSVWSQFDPRGHADLRVKIARPGQMEDGPEPVFGVAVTAKLQGAELSSEAYPYPLADVSGTLRIRGDEMDIEDLAGMHEGAVVRVDGRASLGASGRSRADLLVRAEALPIDDALKSVLPVEGRGALEQFRPRGFVNLSGSLKYEDDRSGLVYDLNAGIYDAAVEYEAFPYRIDEVMGDIRIRPDRISILNLSGRRGPMRIEARGQVSRVEAGRTTELVLACERLALNQELYDALPEPLKSVWDLVSPTGTVDVSTIIRRDPHSIAPHHRTQIDLRGGSLRFKGLPLALTGVDARLLLSERGVEIERLEGEGAEGRISISGRVDLQDGGRSGTLTIRGRDMRLEKEVIDSLPRELREALTSAQPGGKFDVDLDPLYFRAGPEGSANVNYSVRVGLHDAECVAGVALSGMNGTVTAKGRFGNEGEGFLDASIALDRAVVAGWRLEDVKLRVVSGDRPGVVAMQDGSARAYGGEAIGFGELKIVNGLLHYEASITARDLELSKYLQAHHEAKADPKARAARGLIFLNMVLRGHGGPRREMEGAGELSVREAEVWRLPLALAIFQVLNLAPDENVFHDGRVKFFISNDLLSLQDIDLQGKAVSFVGNGKMDLRTRGLDVLLLAGSPVRIRVPVLTELWEGASRELMEVHISGTLAEPKIEPQPLKSLAQALKLLFPPGGAKEEAVP